MTKDQSVMWSVIFNHSMPAIPNCCCLKGSVPDGTNPLFLIVDIQVLWCSGMSARMSKIKNGGSDPLWLSLKH